MPGPEKQYDGDRVTIRLTWEQQQHLEKLVDDRDLDSISEAVRQVLENEVRRAGKDPESNPEQEDLFLKKPGD